MKVLIIFPPQWIPYRAYLSRPYLSVPSLTAYLKANNVDVVQRDLNIEAYDILLSSRYLSGLRDRLENKFKAIDAKKKLAPGVEQAYYNDLFRAKSSLDMMADRVDQAKRIYRTNDFYDVNLLCDARRTLDQSLSIISTAYFPTNPDLMWFAMPPFQGSLSDMLEITQNVEENPFIELYQKHFLGPISAENADIVCISIIYNSQLIPGLTLARLLKASGKKAHIIVGGCVLTLLGESLSSHQELFDEYFDSVALHEGERPLLELVRRLSQGQNLNGVPNLIYREGGEIRSNQIVEAEHINNLPAPCFDGFPLSSYLSPEPVLPLMTSRACYWGKCAFCTDNSLTHRGRYQKRDETLVVNDMLELSQKFGVTHFAFSDECISPSSINKISDEIIGRKLRVRCSTNARLERQFTPELCNKLSSAGFKLLFLGFESGSNRVLNQMNKGITREIAAEVCRNLYGAGVWNHLYVFFGFPSETREEAQETIDFLMNNKNAVHSFNIEAFILETGSPAKKCPEKYGVTTVGNSGHSEFDITSAYKVLTGISYEEADELSRIYRVKIRDEYDSKAVMTHLAQDDIILYLSHYEDTDPFLVKLSKYRDLGKVAMGPVDRSWVPMLKKHVSLNKIHFDLMQVIHNITGGNNLTVTPKVTWEIFDPGSGRSSSINNILSEILGFCDGQRNIRQIAHELSKIYNENAYTIEKDCVALLHPLVKDGFVLNNPQEFESPKIKVFE